MARLGEKHAGTTVPQFGGWDKAGQTNYSMVFSQARAKKKRATRESSRFKPKPDNEFTPLQASDSLDPPPGFQDAPLVQPHDACVFQPAYSHKASQSYQKNSKRGMKRFLGYCSRCMKS